MADSHAMPVSRPADGDPCLCGSGQPFADCCASAYDRTTAAWRRAQDAAQRLEVSVNAYAVGTWGLEILLEAFRSFTGRGSRDLTHRWNLFSRLFAFTWIANWDDELSEEAGIPKDWPTTPLGVAWLESHAFDVSEYDARFILTAAESPVSLLRVDAVRPGWDLTVLDLMTGRPFRVVDPKVSTAVLPEEVLVSAVLTLDGVSTLLGLASCALTLAETRFDAADACRDIRGERWLSRADLLQHDYEVHAIYEDALAKVGRSGPLSVGPEDEYRGPCLVRWRLTSSFEDTLARLRPMTLCFEDEEAIDLDPRPDGEPEADLSWYRRGASGDPDDWEAIGDLFLTRGKLVGSVDSTARADALVDEIAARLGTDARLIELRRVDQRQPVVTTSREGEDS